MSDALLTDMMSALGPGVAVARAPDDSGPLWPEETPAVARAVDKRVAEFTAGRAAARAAMMALGESPSAIRQGADRAPVWPYGLTGSITHTDGLCLAAVARRRDIASLGIDAEARAPLPADVMPRVLSSVEWTDDPIAARAIFSAKEATYKALYPLMGVIWGFRDLEITLGQDGYEARLNRQAGPLGEGTVLAGHLFWTPVHVVTACVIRADDPRLVGG